MTSVSATALDSTARLAELPYTKDLLPSWQSLELNSPVWTSYAEALRAYLDAQETERSLRERYEGLRLCLDRLETLRAQGDVHLASLLLLGRVYLDLGMPGAAAECFSALIDALTMTGEGLDLSWPFMPPLASFDRIPPKDGEVTQWLIAALLEALERSVSESSHADSAAHLPRLTRLHQNPHCSLAMESRLALCALRLGKVISISDEGRLAGPDNRNHLVWRELARLKAASVRSVETSASTRLAKSLHLPISEPPRQTFPLGRSFEVTLDDRRTIDVVPEMCSEHTLLGRSSDGNWFVKVELKPHPLKRNDLLGEAEIVRLLNASGCVSCPRLEGIGRVTVTSLVDLCIIPDEAPETLPALVLPYVPTQSSVGLHDLLFSLQEQRKLGWFHADLRPDNLRLDPDDQVCYLIDYDQAEPLAQEQIEASLVDFLRWADQRVRDKYARFRFKGLFNYFAGIILERDILLRLEQGRLDVGQTKLFRSAETTLNPSKIYHSIDLPDIVAHGERTLDERLCLMNDIRFHDGERVLDIGCNSGLLCAYLASRGCVVKGIDLDPHVIRGARMLSNIRGDQIDFDCIDLDQTDDLGRYDTVMLFSVLHHTQQVPRNAKLIANSCTRIIIECRLREQGAKPVGGRWVGTTAWAFEDADALVEGLCKLFPGFRLLRNHGQADRERYLLELTREGREWSGTTAAEYAASNEQEQPAPAGRIDKAARAHELSREEALRFFLTQNASRWSKIQPRRQDQCVLVELLVGHPAYFIANAVLAKYLQLFHGCAIKAILPRRNDTYLHSLAASYGITDYYYEEDIGRSITDALKAAMLRALRSGSSGADLRKAVLEININGIRVGDLIYDMYLRNTGNVTIEALDDELIGTAIAAIGYYQLYDSIFSENNVVATAVGHAVYTRFGILARVSLAHDAPVYAKKPDPMMVRKYTDLDEFPQPELAFDSCELDYVWRTRRDKAIERGRSRMFGQLFSEARSDQDGEDHIYWHSLAYGSGRQSYDLEKFCSATGVDSNKPIVVIFSHIFSDAPNCARCVFEDYYVWLVETLVRATQNTRVNWIVKPHPDTEYYNPKLYAEEVYERFSSFGNIGLCPPDIDNRSLFEFVHAIVTVHGNAGREFASQGIPVILAGEGTYSGHGFTYDAKTKDDYFSLIDRIHELTRLSEAQVDRAYALDSLQHYYAGATCIYMPDIPLVAWESYDFNDCFLKAAEQVKTYDFCEDPFFRCLIIQLATDAKHLFNYEYN